MRRQLRRAAAFAICGFTAVVSPPRITEVEPARIRHGTRHSTRGTTDQSTGTGITGKGPDGRTCTGAKQATGDRTIAGRGAARAQGHGGHKRRCRGHGFR
jgi:hypothetical protein